MCNDKAAVLNIGSSALLIALKSILTGIILSSLWQNGATLLRA
jgi:hypothetical protein